MATVGTALSLLAFQTVAHFEERETLSRLGRSADLYVGLLREQFARREAVTAAVAGLYGASGTVNRGSLRNHAGLIASDLAGMAALAWLPRTPPQHAARMAGALRALDPLIAGIRAPGGAVIDDPFFDHDLYPFATVEPAEASKVLLGLDAASVYGLHGVLRRAAAGDRVVAGGPVDLVPPAGAAEVVLFAPVAAERPGGTPPHGALSPPRGMIATVFHLDRVVAAAFAAYPTPLFHIHLINPQAAAGSPPLVSVAAMDRPAPSRVSDAALRRTVEWGQRPWVLAFDPTPAATPAAAQGRAVWALLFGLAVTAFGTGYLVLVARTTARLRREVEARARAEIHLRTANERKDLLLKEINHRVKNSLQLVSSLFTMQERRIADPDAKEAFARAVERIRAVAQVHERLYKTDDVTTIDLADYLRRLCNDLTASHPDHTCLVEAADARLPTDTAVSLGLIAAELITNAVKHAHATGDDRTITVTLHRPAAGALELGVRDHGCGVPDGFDPHRTSGSLGMRVIVSLTRQIGGTVAVENAGPGARWTVRFPDPGGTAPPAPPPPLGRGARVTI
ncbi:sensor histidine kinase [Azospirillum halopraeferens]|uniref:sensor histidine kinase n=1 Tax=Azospirillum halopraeferens TaxID=34010 RepID=UPI00041EA3E9|nr:histidine kinase dimerization/phosphoacceptor domain -containing protein [Azospirillum halopraeferens]